MSPTRCLSSYATTVALKLRNPQGTEENWILGGGHINNIVTYCGRVVATEIAVSLLCVTATIELIAYSTLFVVSIGPWMLCYLYNPLQDRLRYVDSLSDLMGSSGFILLWNIGNATYFNLFCINSFTHESFARYSMDYAPCGQAFRAGLKGFTIIFSIAVISLAILNKETNWLILFPSPELFDLPYTSFFRPQDRLFIADWTRNHNINIQLLGLQAAQAQAQIHPIARVGQQVNDTIEEGTEFFKAFILNGQIDADSRQKILEADPDIYVFALTRAVYIYAFGEKRDEITPGFFNAQTNYLIEKLRQNYTQADGIVLESAMQDFSKFEEEPDDPHTKNIFNDLKCAAHKELQGIFVIRCWQKACQEGE